MTLFRRIRPPLHRGGVPVAEDMPPRPPDCRPPAPEPGWASAWASNGALNAPYDPTGTPHPPFAGNTGRLP